MKKGKYAVVLLMLASFVGVLFTACTAPVSSMAASSVMASSSGEAAQKQPAVTLTEEDLPTLTLPEGERTLLSAEELQSLEGSWVSRLVEEENTLYQYRFSNDGDSWISMSHGILRTDEGWFYSGKYMVEMEGIIRAVVTMPDYKSGFDENDPKMPRLIAATLRVKVEKTESVTNMLVFTLLSYYTVVERFDILFKPIQGVPTPYITIW